MKPGGQRNKGHNFERWVANQLKPIYPDARRGFQTRGGGAEECDVEGTPFHIECKHMAKVDVKEAFCQAFNDALAQKTWRRPIVVWKQNRGQVQVTTRLDTLYHLDGIQATAQMLVTFSFGDFLAACETMEGRTR